MNLLLIALLALFLDGSPIPQLFNCQVSPVSDMVCLVADSTTHYQLHFFYDPSYNGDGTVDLVNGDTGYLEMSVSKQGEIYSTHFGVLNGVNE